MLPADSNQPALDSSNTALSAAFATYRRTGDPALLSQVYDRAAPRLLAVALHLGGSEAAAEDAVQETFLVALENADEWDPDRPLMPWLLGILSNKIRQGRRNEHRAPELAPDSALQTRTPHDAAAANEVLSHIEQAIEHLAQPYRTVVILRIRNGLSPADIALALGSNPATVRTHLYRGLTLLKRLLPVSVASVLLGTLTGARGLDSVREVVLDHAAALRRTGHTMLWPGIAFGLLVCIVGLWLWPSGALVTPAPRPDSPEARTTRSAAEPTTRAATELPPVAAPSASRRSRSIGSLRIRVRHGAGTLRGVPLELEPIADGAPLITHHHYDNRGSWQRVASGRPLPPQRMRHAITESNGETTIHDLRSGLWLLRALGQAVPTRVQPGQVGTIEIEAAATTRVVRGRVIRANGQPVAGARIWTCREHVQAVRIPACRSDSAGYFQLAVARFTTIVVSHPGFAPLGCSVGKEKGIRTNLVFRLDRPGCKLTGRVLDAAGRKLRGAVVQIGHPADARVLRYAPTPTPLARPVRVRTNENGEFSVDALQAGRVTVFARAAGHGLTVIDVALEPAGSRHVELTLDPGATLSGQLIDQRTGAPAVGASVHVGRPGTLGRTATTTDATGHYRITGLAAGSHSVVATDLRGAFAHATITCTAGSRETWNGRLSAASLSLAGRVTTALGRPLRRGWIVQSTGWRTDVHQLAEDGSFALTLSDREATYLTRLWAYAADPRTAKGTIEGIPLGVSEPIAPGTIGIEFKLPNPSRSARVHGQFVREDRAQPARLFLRHDGAAGTWRMPLAVIDAAGTFDSGPIPAGRYTLVVNRSDPLEIVGPFEVPTGETLDVGRIREASAEADRGSRGTRRRISVIHPATALPAGGVELTIRDAEQRIVQTHRLPWHVDGASSAILDLQPGTYQVTVEDNVGRRASRQLVVDPNERQLRAILLRLEPTPITAPPK